MDGRQISLTATGRRLAEGVVRKHRLAERLLTDVIGLPWHRAHLEAGRHTLHAWTGIRCASTDRRPLVGPLHEDVPDGLWLSTAMGSRGLTFAALAGELIAAGVHGEPLPLARKLALALSPSRHKNRATARANARE